jgi:hypothetical protein
VARYRALSRSWAKGEKEDEDGRVSLKEVWNI